MYRFIAAPSDGGAVGLVLRVRGIIVAKLQQDEVAGLQALEDLRPQPFFDVRAAAASAVRFVVDVNFRRVEKRDDFRSPTPLTAFARAIAGLDDRIADEEQRGVERGRRLVCGILGASGRDHQKGQRGSKEWFFEAHDWGPSIFVKV